MALPTIVKIYNRSDFTVQLPLAEGYDGQEFRFTLYTCGEPENGWVASYIDGAYTNCTVNEDVVTIYVNNNNNMNPGCLTVRSEYDYFNGHFADNEDNVKDVYKTNIYLVNYRTNAFSASFRPSNLPDLTGTNDYVTFADINAMGYITSSELSQMSYITNNDVEQMLSGYATEAYVAEYVSQYAPEYDMSAYVTKSELNAASYAPKSLLIFKQDTLVSGQNIKTINNESILGAGNLNVISDLTGYATESYVISHIQQSQSYMTDYVADYVAAYAPTVDLSGYVTQEALSSMGYITTIPSEYVTQSELEACGYVNLNELNNILDSYVTHNQLANSHYATESYVHTYYYDKTYLNQNFADKSYVAQYVSEHAGDIDLTTYVTKNELSEMGYVTQTSLSSNSYVTNAQLSNKSYATKSYVEEYVATHTADVDLSAYVTQTYLSSQSYVTNSQLSAKSYVTQNSLSANGYATKSYVEEYVATHTADVDLSSYVTKTELSGIGYVTQTYLSSQSYASQAYVAQYVSDHAGDIDLTSYVTKTELSGMSYVTQTSLSSNSYVTKNQLNQALDAYVTHNELNSLGYITQNDLSSNSYVTESYLESKQYVSGPFFFEEQVSVGALINNGDGTYTTVDLASKEYVRSYVATYAPQVDLTGYATESYVVSQIQQSQSYMTDYVADYVATYAPQPDLSAYVTHTELDNASYITQDELSANAYLSQDALNSMSYGSIVEITQYDYDLLSTAQKNNGAIYVITDANDYDMSYYATKAYVADYVATYGGGGGGSTPDMSAYVTKTELDNAGYVTSQTLSSYAKLTDLSSYLPLTGGYLTGPTYINTYQILTTANFSYDSSTGTLTIIL